MLGFHNATLTPLVREHGIGWATRRGDVEGLLQQLVRILNDPDLLQRARRAGLDLVGRNDFEYRVGPGIPYRTVTTLLRPICLWWLSGHAMMIW